MADKEALLTIGELAQLLGLLLGALIIITLIVLDIHKLLKKGNFWVLGYPLVFNALIIQLMNFIEEQVSLLNHVVVYQNLNFYDCDSRFN